MFLRTSGATSSLVAGPKIAGLLLSQKTRMIRKVAMCSSLAVGFLSAVVMTVGAMIQNDPMAWTGAGVLVCSFVGGCASRFIPVEPTMKRNKSDSALNLAAEAEAAEP